MKIHFVQNFCQKHLARLIPFLILSCLFNLLFANGNVSASYIASNHIQAHRPVRVLFIGNSYTYFNNLPRILEQLSTAAGTPMETKMVAEGGATLHDHWEKGEALKAIRERSWNYVILQEQSTLGTFLVNGQDRIADPQYFHQYARLFDQEIKKSGAQTIFYLTWARKDAPERNQALLNYAYISIARELKDLIVPAGVVWQEVRHENPNLELYLPDRSHPTATGSYLVACELYATIYGKTPVGLPYQITINPVDEDGNVDTQKQITLAKLSASDAELIQRAAWKVYQKMKASGGYLSVPKPPSPDLPTLPAGQKPTSKDLEGLWVGKLNFYPVPWPAKMELTLHQTNGEWKAELKIKFEGHPEADKAPQITSFKITDTGISFLDPKGASGAPMKYRAAFTGHTLSGLAEVKVEGKPIHAIGTWELKRQD